MSKIAILNYSGNVGKTTLAHDLLHYRMSDYILIHVESVNADGKENTIIRGENGEQLHIEMLLNDNLIMDIGSSNLEAFFYSGERESDILNSIDLFIVPVIPDIKQQRDTIKTVHDLLEKGVAANKIIVIPNMVENNTPTPPKETFAILSTALQELNVPFDLKNGIERHQLYGKGNRLADMITQEDHFSLMEAAKAVGDMDKARYHATQHTRQKQLRGLNAHYQKVKDRIMSIINANNKRKN